MSNSIWEAVPEGHDCIAYDSTGEVYAYSEGMRRSKANWVVGGFRHLGTVRESPWKEYYEGVSWDESLRRRPSASLAECREENNMLWSLAPEDYNWITFSKRGGVFAWRELPIFEHDLEVWMMSNEIIAEGVLIGNMRSPFWKSYFSGVETKDSLRQRPGTQKHVAADDAIDELQKAIHENAVAHGWWEDDRSPGELIALIHSELSEALEAFRDGNPESEKIPGFTQAEEELADTIIRILDMAQWHNFSLAEAIAAKHKYNTTRPYKHGKEF
jgi:NTP pyrophosphatase (non-canonical NTP hydrolase)